MTRDDNVCVIPAQAGIRFSVLRKRMNDDNLIKVRGWFKKQEE